MESMLKSSLISIGINVVGEITLSMIKKGSNKIIESFKSKFSNKYGISDEKSLCFLNEICEKRCTTKEAFEEVEKIFLKNINKLSHYNFETDFKNWLEENSDNFINLCSYKINQKSSIVINGNIKTDRGGSVQIIGNQYNNYMR